MNSTRHLPRSKKVVNRVPTIGAQCQQRRTSKLFRQIENVSSKCWSPRAFPESVSIRFFKNTRERGENMKPNCRFVRDTGPALRIYARAPQPERYAA